MTDPVFEDVLLRNKKLEAENSELKAKLAQVTRDREACWAFAKAADQTVPCTCGSGAHPRECNRHGPLAKLYHIAELQAEWSVENVKEAEDEQERLQKELDAVVFWLDEFGGVEGPPSVKVREAMDTLRIKIAKQGRTQADLKKAANKMAEAIRGMKGSSPYYDPAGRGDPDYRIRPASVDALRFALDDWEEAVKEDKS